MGWFRPLVSVMFSFVLFLNGCMTPSIQGLGPGDDYFVADLAGRWESENLTYEVEALNHAYHVVIREKDGSIHELELLVRLVVIDDTIIYDARLSDAAIKELGARYLVFAVPTHLFGKVVVSGDEIQLFDLNLSGTQISQQDHEPPAEPFKREMFGLTRIDSVEGTTVATADSQSLRKGIVDAIRHDRFVELTTLKRVGRTVRDRHSDR